MAAGLQGCWHQPCVAFPDQGTQIPQHRVEVERDQADGDYFPAK